VATTLSLGQRRRFALRASETAFYALWRLLTSVRIAIVTVLLLGATMLLGVLLPQIPAAVRDQPGLTGAWLELQWPRFGPVTPVLHWLGLFDVFHARWFWGLVAWLALAITVCTYSRLPRLWRQAFRPPRRVPDGLFDRLTRADVAYGADPEMVERVLRRRRFKVWRLEESGVTYLFADRFPWASLGTILSHLALILFLAGALVSKLDGFGTNLTIAESATAPVFPVGQGSQIVVQVQEAVGAFDLEGRPLDYHSDLVLYRDGYEAKRCTITVNSPCRLDGYRFHQAGFFGFGAELRVRDVQTGNTVYREVLALNRGLPAPQMTIRGSDGATLFEGTVPQTEIVEGSLAHC
jgi:cytochrome c biogenesis protein